MTHVLFSCACLLHYIIIAIRVVDITIIIVIITPNDCHKHPLHPEASSTCKARYVNASWSKIGVSKKRKLNENRGIYKFCGNMKGNI